MHVARVTRIWRGAPGGGASRGRSALLVLTASLLLFGCGGSPPTTPTPSVVYRFGVVGNAGRIAPLVRRTPTVVADVPGDVVQIATSNSDGYALTARGEVWAWGVASAGELGDGRTSPYVTHAVRVDFPAGVRIAALANPMPFDAGLAIDRSGRAWGWGLDATHDLCLGGLEELRPQPIPLEDVTLATGARTHSLFDARGRVYACGSGDAGELGDGSTADRGTPTPVVGLPRSLRVTALTSSWEGSGALLADGSYYDWGFNPDGQLGDGRTTDSDTPVRVPLPAPARQVSQGGSGEGNGQTVALLDDGSVWTWGDGRKGQLGDGSRTNSAVPVRVDVAAGVRFVDVDSGGYACYGIDRSGRLWAWGGNVNGQLGTGSKRLVETHPVPVPIRVSQISSTASNVAALHQAETPEPGAGGPG